MISSIQSQSLQWLQLPGADWAPFTDASLQYGAGKVAANYCGLKVIPQTIQGVWVHGWTPDYMCVEPSFAVGQTVDMGRDSSCFVGTKFLRDYLHANHVSARAIGLPITYLPEKKYVRKSGSLLVMPSHSLEYTKHAWHFKEYAETIRGLRDDFDPIVVCLHPACVKNGYWINEFKELGFPIITGANQQDQNALERIRALMSQFEYVTTNGFGSVLAYAAAYGAKLSLFGPFCEYKEGDFTNCGFYQNHPGMLAKGLHLFSESRVRKEFPDLFVHPSKAEERSKWGQDQIGFMNRISPSQMRRAFGWSWYHKPIRKTKFYYHVAANRLFTKAFKQRIDEWADPELRVLNTEIRRLRSMPENQASTATLKGLSFYFKDAGKFLSEYESVFNHREVEFPCVKGAPRIVDWGAGIGVKARYWANRFPEPEIHVFETDPESALVLEKNRSLLSNGSVEIHTRPDALHDLLRAETDFLVIDLPGREGDLLAGISGNLTNVDRLLVVYYSMINHGQCLSNVLETIKLAGMRYHLTNLTDSRNPFLLLNAERGADLITKIWAHKGSHFPRMR